MTDSTQASLNSPANPDHYRILFDASPDALFVLNAAGQILDVNRVAVERYGYTRAELLKMSARDLAAPDLHEQIPPRIRETLASGMRFEWRHCHRNGSQIWVEVSARPFEFQGQAAILSSVRDISGRKQADARISALNRLYATLSQINQVIVRARDRSTLFQDICRVAIEQGKYHMAWIGLVDPQTQVMCPMTFCGEEQGYLANVRISAVDETEGRGPTGTAIRQGCCVICQDIATDPRMTPWRDKAVARGFLSSAAVPFREHGRIVGALTVYASQPYDFTMENENLLNEIGGDISYALEMLDARDEIQRAHSELTLAYDATIEGWSRALDLRDRETEGHTLRVVNLTLELAQAMGVESAELIHYRRGALLHDIGKLGVPDQILFKPGSLTTDEWKIMRLHPVYAYEMLAPINYLRPAIDIPYGHHERWDGAGYPRALKGEQIPIAARIFSIVDVYDALRADRHYRQGWAESVTLDYLREQSGKQFDPRVVETFLQLLVRKH